MQKFITRYMYILKILIILRFQENFIKSYQKNASLGGGKSVCSERLLC